MCLCLFIVSFFFNDTATPEIYTYYHPLSLHDALPISSRPAGARRRPPAPAPAYRTPGRRPGCGSRRSPGRDSRDSRGTRSEEHTSELQSLMRISYDVFCLKKKKRTSKLMNTTTI